MERTHGWKVVFVRNQLPEWEFLIIYQIGQDYNYWHKLITWPDAACKIWEKIYSNSWIKISPRATVPGMCMYLSHDNFGRLERIKSIGRRWRWISARHQRRSLFGCRNINWDIQWRTFTHFLGTDKQRNISFKPESHSEKNSQLTHFSKLPTDSLFHSKNFLQKAPSDQFSV